MSDQLTNEISALYNWLFNKGVELLSRREHSRVELKAKLHQKTLASKQWQSENPEFVNREVNKALAKLEEYDYLCDKRFAQAFVNSRFNKGYGSNRIKQELKHKGISDDLIAFLLQKECTADIENTGVYRAWERKFKVFPQELKERAKQQRFLIYRGFGFDEVGVLFEHLKQNNHHQ